MMRTPTCRVPRAAPQHRSSKVPAATVVSCSSSRSVDLGANPERAYTSDVGYARITTTHDPALGVDRHRDSARCVDGKRAGADDHHRRHGHLSLRHARALPVPRASASTSIAARRRADGSWLRPRTNATFDAFLDRLQRTGGGLGHSCGARDRIGDRPANAAPRARTAPTARTFVARRSERPSRP